MSGSTAPVPPPPADSLPRRVEKPWGHEIIWAHAAQYVGKLIVIETGKRLSFQYHEAKDEWIYVLSGRLLLTLENAAGVVEDRELGPGEGAHVAVLRKHRYTAIETCTLIEVSTPPVPPSRARYAIPAPMMPSLK